MQMLEELHGAGHCIGVLLLESILIQPELLCLEFATGCNCLTPAPWSLALFVHSSNHAITCLECCATYVDKSAVHIPSFLSSTPRSLHLDITRYRL